MGRVKSDGDTVVVSRDLFLSAAETLIDRAADARSIAFSEFAVSAVCSAEFQALLPPEMLDRVRRYGFARS